MQRVNQPRVQIHTPCLGLAPHSGLRRAELPELFSRPRQVPVARTHRHCACANPSLPARPPRLPLSVSIHLFSMSGSQANSRVFRRPTNCLSLPEDTQNAFCTRPCVLQSCLTPHGLHPSRQEHWSGCHALLKGLPEPGTEPSPPNLLRLLHYRWILYRLNHARAPDHASP